MTIDEFSQADLRVGTVKAAERVEGSNKLLKLQIDLGAGEGGEPDLRQILSGIGMQYEPEDMLGRQVVVIANLEPRMMMGLESQGMVLAASDEDADGGSIALLVVDREVAPGSAIH
jgi:methionyl-tRNA synthetase